MLDFDKFSTFLIDLVMSGRYLYFVIAIFLIIAAILSKIYIFDMVKYISLVTSKHMKVGDFITISHDKVEHRGVIRYIHRSEIMIESTSGLTYISLAQLQNSIYRIKAPTPR